MNAMPLQFAPVISVMVVICSAIIEGAAAVTVVQLTPIVTSSTLRAWCVIGAVFGAIVAVVIFPPESPNTVAGMQRVLCKFLGSSLLGFMYGPVASRYLGVQVNEDMVMFVAGSISLFGVVILHAVVPLIPAFVRSIATGAVNALKAAFRIDK